MVDENILDEISKDQQSLAEGDIKILFVTQKEDALKSTLRFLKKRNWNYVVVNSMKQALDSIANIKPTHVLISWYLPGTNLKKMEDGLVGHFGVKVIFYAEYFESTTFSQLKNGGFLDVILAPISGPTVQMKIKAISKIDNLDEKTSGARQKKQKASSYHARPDTEVQWNCTLESLPGGGYWQNVPEKDPVAWKLVVEDGKLNEEEGFFYFEGKEPPSFSDGGTWDESPSGGRLYFVPRIIHGRKKEKKKSWWDNANVAEAADLPQKESANYKFVVESAAEAERDDKNNFSPDDGSLIRAENLKTQLQEAIFSESKSVHVKSAKPREKTKLVHIKGAGKIERARKEAADNIVFIISRVQPKIGKVIFNASENGQRLFPRPDEATHPFFDKALQKNQRLSTNLKEVEEFLTATEGHIKPSDAPPFIIQKGLTSGLLNANEEAAKRTRAPLIFQERKVHEEYSAKQEGKSAPRFSLMQERVPALEGKTSDSMNKENETDGENPFRQKKKNRYRNFGDFVRPEGAASPDLPIMASNVAFINPAEASELSRKAALEKALTQSGLDLKGSSLGKVSRVDSEPPGKLDSVSREHLERARGNELDLQIEKNGTGRVIGPQADSILAQSAKLALRELANQTKEAPSPVQNTRSMGLILVKTSQAEGVLMVAWGNNRKVTKGFLVELRERIQHHLRSKGQPPEYIDDLELQIDQFDFVQWCGLHAEFLAIDQFEIDELAIAFMPGEQYAETTGSSAEKNMAAIETIKLIPGKELDFDIYIYLPTNKKYLRYFRKGQTLDGQRLEKLINFQMLRVHIQKEDVEKFKAYCASFNLNNRIHNKKIKKAS